VHAKPVEPVATPKAESKGPSRGRSQLISPSLGMHYINKNLVWYQGQFTDGSGVVRPFWYATTDTLSTASGDDTITIIAGSVGEPDLGYSVAPPVQSGENYQRGLCVEHVLGAGDGKREVVTVTRGFLWVHVQSKAAARGKLPLWPLVIRTKAIPAGAYSTEFVLLALRVSDDVPLREYAFRPNQQADGCDRAAEPDEAKSVIVYVQPKDDDVQSLDDTKTIAYNAGPSTLSTHATIDDAAEAKFIRDACAFSKAAIGAIPSSSSNWRRVEAAPCFEQPPARGTKK
jgi:hypothetical protein